MFSNLIELVISELASRGLRIERIHMPGSNAPDRRLLLIEGKRCQVIPSKLSHPNAGYPGAEYFPLYLPRTDWPDFLIYVSATAGEPLFYIVPRAEVSKDTGRAPQSLEIYRNAWELLQQVLPDYEKGFEVLSWQLRAVTESARSAGLEVELLPTKKHKDGRAWPPVIKRGVLIAGKKCAIFSASRIIDDPSRSEYNYAAFRIPKDKWAEFILYVVKKADNTHDTFVIPLAHLTAWTTASLDHPELARYKNAWSLLEATPAALAEIPPIQWKAPRSATAPTRRELIMKETIRRAEREGLSIESAGDTGGHAFLYVNKRRCHILTATPAKSKNSCAFVTLNPPQSEWAEVLVFYSIQTDEAKFYIIPRKVLSRPTSRSLESKWLREYEEAWHLLH